MDVDVVFGIFLVIALGAMLLGYPGYRLLTWVTQRMWEPRGEVPSNATPGGFPVIGPEGSSPLTAQPVADAGPGVYRIVGVNAATCEDVDLRVQALSLANAMVKAQLKGVVVTHVAKEPDSGE